MNIKLITPTIILLLFLPAMVLLAQGDNSKTVLHQNILASLPQDKSIRDSLLQWQERIVLQLDKKAAMPRDVLFFKAYVLTGPQRLRVSASDVLRIELLNEEGELLKTQNHKLRLGASDGSLKIPKGLRPGTYYLRAYTRWMLNYGNELFALQKIQIGNTSRHEDGKRVAFYPEGGALVAGLDNRLIMTIDGSFGLNFQIIDNQDQVISNVKKFGEDTYAALFTPKKGNRYFLESKDGEKYALPLVKEYGCTLQASTIDGDYIDMKIQKSPELLKKKLFIGAQSDGITYLDTALDFNEGSSTHLQIPKADLPSGILRLSVMDDSGQVWAERMVHNYRDELRIEVVPRSNESDGRIESFTVKVTNSAGQPISTELAVSIGIEDGRVENKGNAVSNSIKNLRKQQFIDDLSVLTNRLPGYTASLREMSFPEAIYYDFQDGLEFYGQAYSLTGRILKNSDLQLLITTDDEVIAREVQTDSNGMFRVSGLQLVGEATLVTRKIGEDTKSKMVRVRPYVYEIPPLKKSIVRDFDAPRLQKTKSAQPKAVTKTTDFLVKDEGVIILDGITLIEEHPEKISSPSVYGIKPTRKVVQDPNLPRTIPQLFLGIPGFNVSNLGGMNPRLVIPRSMGVGPLLWVIDGFPLSQSSAKPMGQRTSALREIMDLVSYVDIDRIEVLTGADASLYGSRASGGVILIYTRTGHTEDYYARKDGQLSFNGYHKSLDFNSYRAFTGKKRNPRRNGTLYWNPNLRTDEKGSAIIEVDLPEKVTNLRFEALTIAPDGKKGSFEYTF